MKQKKMICSNLRHIISFLFAIVATSAYSQQGAILKPMDFDSTQVNIENHDLKNQRFTRSLFTEPLAIRSGFLAKIPNFNYEQSNSIKFDFNIVNGFPNHDLSFGNMGLSPSPFFQNATILSQDAYAFGDKIIVGGYSYMRNSMLSPPIINQSPDNFNSYGSTLFLQYKVAKGFKIETRFNITNRPGRGFY